MHGRRPPAVWLGTTDGEEFGPLARHAAASLDLIVYADLAAALASPGNRPPGLVILAIDVSARFVAADIHRLVTRWPLATLLGVTASLADGRRRAGPMLPGIREVPWIEAGGLVERWIVDADAGRAGWASLPRTLDREEWLLESAAATLRRPPPDAPGRRPALEVAAAAPTRSALGPLADLLDAAGYPPVAAFVGPPPVAVAAEAVVWDAAGDLRCMLPDVQSLAERRPDLSIVLLESFPRGEVASVALRAGAAAVIGRPVPLLTLAETLGRLSTLRHGRPSS